MSLILAIPFEFRLVLLFVAGTCVGALVNLGAYRLAWSPRRISPWSPPEAKAPPRRFDDRIPVVGWLGLRRESALHGRGFWIRPMLVEVLLGVGLAGLYWWEVVEGGLTSPLGRAESPLVLHVRYLAHVLLIALMAAGSLIDLDEKIIPDSVTLPGTLAGLALAAVFPWALLPTSTELGFVYLNAPNPLPEGWFGAEGVGIAWGCWWLWCFALMPRTWYGRHGWLRAVGLCCARLRRDVSTRWLVLLGGCGSVAIGTVWAWGGDVRWIALLTSLVGMLGGALIIWVVRIVGTTVLGREAMGFGDVTLMAMLGTLLGWQACLMIFFLAPFAGLVLGVTSLLLRRETEIPYGPFLCLAALAVMVRWGSFWDYAQPLFGMGLLVPGAVAVCMVLMAVMLGAWRLLRTLTGWAE